MHIPDTLLQGGICTVTATISSIGLTVAVVAAAKSKQKPTPAAFGAMAALIFVAQMLNFPVAGDTSGHLLGGVLAVALLGLPFGVLAMALVVLVQCLVFADGGIASLGANLLNMALIASSMGALFRLFEDRWDRAGLLVRSILLAGVAWLSVMVAAVAVSLELAAAGSIGLAAVSQAMLSVHALIGIGESLMTVAAFWVLAPLRFDARNEKRALQTLAMAGILALLLSPLASSLPDGLEWVADRYQLLLPSAGRFGGLLPGYALPGASHPYLATILAGVAGAALVFGSAWLLAQKLKQQ